MRIKNSISSTIYAAMLFSFMLSGCQVLDSQVKHHHQSCGPEAILKLERKFNNKPQEEFTKEYTDKELERYSKIILKHDRVVGSVVRRFLSIFGAVSYDITWNHEMHAALEELGYEVDIMRGDSDNLKISYALARLAGRRGIVLTRHGFLSWHWSMFPTDNVVTSRKNSITIEELIIVKSKR